MKKRQQPLTVFNELSHIHTPPPALLSPSLRPGLVTEETTSPKCTPLVP